MLLTIEGKDEDGARESVLGGRVALVSSLKQKYTPQCDTLMREVHTTDI